eukprot:GHVH01011499.1.p1 GENE.GHVH01011499.1~~GHVH01011499.1.p1  ORF type:complete len:384 (-),score=48.45 GHVH01011499.1:1016-2167(-)
MLYSDIRLIINQWSMEGKYQGQALVLLRNQIVLCALPPWTIFIFANRLVLVLHQEVPPELTARFIKDLSDLLRRYQSLSLLIVGSTAIIPSSTWAAVMKETKWPQNYQDLETEVLRLVWSYWQEYMRSSIKLLNDRSDALFLRGEGCHVDSDVYTLYIAEIQDRVHHLQREVRSAKLALEALLNLPRSLLIHSFNGRRLLFRSWESVLRYNQRYNRPDYETMVSAQYEDACRSMKQWSYESLKLTGVIDVELEEYGMELQTKMARLVEHSAIIFASSNENRLIRVATHVMITFWTMIGIILGVNVGTVPVTPWYGGLLSLSILSVITTIGVVVVAYLKYTSVIHNSYRTGLFTGDKSTIPTMATMSSSRHRKESLYSQVDLGS